MVVVLRALRVSLAAALAGTLMGCGVSPEYLDEPQAPTTPEEASTPSPVRRDSRQSQVWQCAGSTARTRQQGRLSRNQSVEGFSTRNCIAPSTEVELNPNP